MTNESSTMNCSMVNELTSSSLQCNFLIENECLEEEAMDYVYFVYCVMGADLRWLSIIMIVLIMVVFFLTLSSIADIFLCPSLLTMAKSLRMSDSLAGVTFLAFGNGCSDIFSSLAAASSGKTDLIVSELLGAGIFCLSIVAGLIFITKDFRLAYRPLLRDTIFYLIAVYYTWYICWAEEITFYQSLIFILLYALYLIVALGGQAIHSRLRGQYEPSEIETKEGVAISSHENQDSEVWFSSRDSSLRKRRRSNSAKVSSESISLISNNKSPLQYGLDKTTKVRLVSEPCSGSRKKDIFNRRSLDAKFLTGYAETSDDSLKKERGCINEVFSLSTEKDLDTVQEAIELDGAEINNPIKYDKEKEMYELSPSNLKDIDKLKEVISNENDLEQLVRFKNDEKNKQEWSIYRADNLTLNDWDDLLAHINPFEIENWYEASIFVKLVIIFRAPLVFIATCTIPVVDKDKRNDNWCRLLNSLHCMTIPLVIVLSNKISQINNNDGPFGVSYPVIILLAGLLLATFILKTTKSHEPPSYHVTFAFTGFLMSVLWVYLLVTEILGLLKTIGIIFGMSDAAIGLAFLAWGNSLGDIVSNLTLAEAGYPRMALGASVGAPLLNLLIGFGLSFSISLSPGESAPIPYQPTFTLLCLTLAIIIISLMLCTLVPPEYSRKPFGYILIFSYVIYFIIATCFEFKTHVSHIMNKLGLTF